MGCASSLGASLCGTFSAYLECAPGIHQGTDGTIEIQLLDSDGLPLDLNNTEGIYICVFDIGDNVIAEFSSPDMTSTIPLTICQSTTFTTDGEAEFEQQGVIKFDLTADLTACMMTGPLNVEIKLKAIDTNWPGGVKYKVISCLKIGTVQESKTKNINDF